jgi:hypothetical protein
MAKVFVLQAQGYGDREDEFYNVGVYSSKVNAEMAQRNFIAEALEDGLDAETQIETWELDA